MTDQDFLKKAIEVGNEVDEPYNFGAVVVKDGKLQFESKWLTKLQRYDATR